MNHANTDSGIRWSSAFAHYLTGRERCILDKAAQDRDVPKSPIIATGGVLSAGVPSFIVYILSVRAHCARRRWEGTIMKLPRRKFLHLAAGAAALPAVSRIARAQAYPTRPVRIIVGFPPGGGSDILARLMGQWLSERLKQTFVVENRPGAGANIATEAVVRAFV
jgi:hypothetical protein